MKSQMIPTFLRLSSSSGSLVFSAAYYYIQIELNDSNFLKDFLVSVVFSYAYIIFTKLKMFPTFLRFLNLPDTVVFSLLIIIFSSRWNDTKFLKIFGSSSSDVFLPHTIIFMKLGMIPTF